MVDVSTNHMQSNGYRLNVEDSKYLIFESEDYSKKTYHLERIAFDLIFVNSVKIIKKNKMKFIHVS